MHDQTPLEYLIRRRCCFVQQSEQHFHGVTGTMSLQEMVELMIGIVWLAHRSSSDFVDLTTGIRKAIL